MMATTSDRYNEYMQLGKRRHEAGAFRQAGVDFERAAYYAKSDELGEDVVEDNAMKSYESFMSAAESAKGPTKTRSINDAKWVVKEYGLKIN